MKIYGDFITTLDKALSEINPNWKDLEGVIIAGSHTPNNIDFILEEIEKARENKIPLLGICWGYQMVAIEYARNVLNIKDATSEEWGNGTFIVKKRPELKVGVHEGESWWSNYDVCIDFRYPEWFVVAPYHPEYQSSKDNPHQLLTKFLKLCNAE